MSFVQYFINQSYSRQGIIHRLIWKRTGAWWRVAQNMEI